MAVLTQGAISSVIDGEKGYYVIKVIDRKEPEVKPLSKVQNKIRHQLMVIKKKQVRDKFYTTLKKNINVSVNDTALARVKLSGKKSDNKIPPKLPEQ